MKSNNVFCNWDFNLNISDMKDVDIWIDCFDNLEKSTKKIKVLYLIEPVGISEIYNKAYRLRKKFNYILSSDKKFIKKCKNAILFEFGTTWISNYHFKEKSFGVSTIIGDKMITLGHKMREELYCKENNITIPTRFYISQYSIKKGKYYLKEKKDPAFNMNFHIVIENEKKDFYFTEKLIDCFQTKTIPIYWGCPGIAKYFDTEGIIKVKSAYDIISKCNNLNKNYYLDRMEIINKNYELSKKWAEKLEIRLKCFLKSRLQSGYY